MLHLQVIAGLQNFDAQKVAAVVTTAEKVKDRLVYHSRAF